MLTVLSDTHGTDDPRLRGRTLEAVREADLVVHAGDFTTEAALSAHREAAAELVAVHGNADERAVREQLPPLQPLGPIGRDLCICAGVGRR